ncbi:hypothetical protein PAMP_013881 [Pampus punctatissimus]
MERKEQCSLNPGLNQTQDHNIHAEETCAKQDSPLQTTDATKSKKALSMFPCHEVIGARPYCSPEYSPDFHKYGSTLPCSKFGVPYLEKKRLLDKDEEIQEVKQLDEWKPAVGIFTAVLEGLHHKAN